MGAVVFSPTDFKNRYPEFSAVYNVTLAACFTEACIYLSNLSNSPVQDIPRRTLLLWMLTAHVAYIGGLLSTDGMPRPVGRISQATEGSVSASFEGMTPGSAQWFQSSQYGASYWQATSSLRGFRYSARPTTWK